MSNSDHTGEPSRSTVEGQAVGFASDLSGQHGWRRTAGRTIAYLWLAAIVVLILAGIVTVVVASG